MTGKPIAELKVPSRPWDKMSEKKEGDTSLPGWQAVLADTDTHLKRGGPLRFKEAKARATVYLEARLAALTDEPAERRAQLRLALLRILALAEP